MILKISRDGRSLCDGAALFEGKDKHIIYLTSLMARPTSIHTATPRRSDESLGEVDLVLV